MDKPQGMSSALPYQEGNHGLDLCYGNVDYTSYASNRRRITESRDLLEDYHESRQHYPLSAEKRCRGGSERCINSHLPKTSVPISAFHLRALLARRTQRVRFPIGPKGGFEA